MFSRARFGDWTLLLACNLIWASQFVLVKLVQDQMGPVSAAALPLLAATILLVPLVKREQRASGKRRVPRADLVRFVLLGIFGQVVAQLFITWGVRLSLASNAALLSLALPISTAVMAYFFLGERMTVVRWISFALALAGVMFCSGVDWKELNMGSSKYLAGNFLIFLSINGSAFYNAYSKKVLDRYSPLQVLLYSYYGVCAVLLPVTAAVEPGVFRNLSHFTTGTWLGLAALAVFQYFLSMAIFLKVLTRLDATQAAVSNYLIPFMGVVLAAVFLRERLTWFMVAGGMLVLISTIMVTVYEERRIAARAGG